MSHPDNQSHPEPMRIWPMNANKGRGDMFFEFCPIRHKEWKIEPQQSYELNYRMLVFDGKITPQEADHTSPYLAQVDASCLHLAKMRRWRSIRGTWCRDKGRGGAMMSSMRMLSDVCVVCARACACVHTWRSTEGEAALRHLLHLSDTSHTSPTPPTSR